jgi:cyanophycinase
LIAPCGGDQYLQPNFSCQTDTDEAFVWQISHAGGGDFVVLRTSGDDAYNPYIFVLSVASGAKLNSVTTILLKNKKASAEKEVLDILNKADAIFTAGGDQSEYLDFWVGTDIQTIIQTKITNITIGGTSAGCMVLGNWVYSASAGSIDSDKALANPYDKYMTIVPAFLKIPYLESVITDTHFVTRNRMGRMLTFNSRIMKDIDTIPPSLSRSVGIDENTALLLNVHTGVVSTVGIGTAYVCTADHSASVCISGKPLTYQSLSCTRLSGKSNDQYSFASWSGSGTVFTSNIVAGAFTNEPYGPI